MDTEEQIQKNNFKVPTTPGSLFGGSRNLMKTKNSVFEKYTKNGEDEEEIKEEEKENRKTCPGFTGNTHKTNDISQLVSKSSAS